MQTIKNMLAGPDSPFVAELAKAFGTDAAETQAAVRSVVDQISQRMERLTLSRGGLAELVRAVGDSHHESYLKDPSLIRSEGMEADGKAILDHVFWSKDRSRGVAAKAARASGLAAGEIEGMLPSIAALTMGELTRAAAGPIDVILRQIPGLDETLKRMQSNNERRTPEVGSSGNGNAARSDSGRALPEQRPLPIPGENVPSPDRGGARYDDLSDILRRGGFKIPGGRGSTRRELPDGLPGNPGGGGGALNEIIRTVLGALLGFKSSGFLGWLLRLIIYRWGWGFIQRILSRVLLGR
ncbi:MAG: DUF937 domain-containing protein [Hyphomicrobiaceae bacterium]